MRQCTLRGSQAMADAVSAEAKNLEGSFNYVETNQDRDLDVIHTLSFESEVALAQTAAKAEGLTMIHLKINGIDLKVSANAERSEVQTLFLSKNGSLKDEGYFELNIGPETLLDNAVYNACLISRMLDKPVQFSYQLPSRPRYETATVFKQDSPDDVFKALKPVEKA